MRRVLCVLYVVTLGNAAVRFPREYGTDSSAYLQHNEESKLHIQEKLQVPQVSVIEIKSNIPADRGIEESGDVKDIDLTDRHKEAVNYLCNTTDNGEDKADDVVNGNMDSNKETGDKDRLDVRYMEVTDDSSRNGCKESNKQGNSALKTGKNSGGEDFSAVKTETISPNTDTAPIAISLSVSSHISEKSSVDENSSNAASSASSIVKEPSFSRSSSVIEHNSDDRSSSNNIKTEITLTDSNTTHLLTVSSSSDASVDKKINIDKPNTNFRHESLQITTTSNTPFTSRIDAKEEFKSDNFNSNPNKDQSNIGNLSNSSNTVNTDTKPIISEENGKVTTDLPPFVSGSGIGVKDEFQLSDFSSNTNDEHSNSLSNSYSHFQTDTKSTNLDESVTVATELPMVNSKNDKNNINDVSIATSSIGLTESTSSAPYIGGNKYNTKEPAILINSDSNTHVPHTSNGKVSDSSFDHSKSTTESINYQNNYSAVSSDTTGDGVSFVKPLLSNKEVIKNEHVSGDNHKDTILTDTNKENASIILIVVSHNGHEGFGGNKGGHAHHYNDGHRHSHESDSSDSSDESDESWEKDHHRHHQYNSGHHYSHGSDSSGDSSDQSDESWEEGHNFRFYGLGYDNNDAAEDLEDSWIG